jgi:hypothetical protein
MAANSSRGVSEPIPITAGTEYHWQVCTQDDGESPPRTNCSKDQTLYVGPVSCNPITRNTWVTNDLANCAPSIGAADISVHLQGHTFGGSIVNNGFDGVTIEGGTAEGVYLTDARDNAVRDMSLSPAPGEIASAIQVIGDSRGTVIAGNTTFAIGVTLNVNASGLRILRNRVTGYGLTGGNKQGPFVVRGDDNHIEENSAQLLHQDGLGRGVGDTSINVSGNGNILLRNTANDSVLNGIIVSGTNAVVIGNVANNNGREFSFGNGISVNASPASVGDNTANGNAQLGIGARADVTDLGGNHASGNGTAAQCTGVVCQP